MAMHINTTSNMGTTCLKAMFFFTLIFTTLNCYTQSQKKRVDTVQISYGEELRNHLYPPVDSLTTMDLALFMVFPEVKANSSLRLIEKNGKSYLEVRCLEKNVWVEVLTSFVNHSYKPMKLKVNNFSVSVSEQFSKMILVVFNKVILWNCNKINSKKNWVYDGTSFDFRINDNGKITIISFNSDLDSTDYRLQVANTNLQIINDIKNGSFNESKYNIYK